MEDFIVSHQCTELKYEWFGIKDMERLCAHIVTPNWETRPDICWETDYCEDKNGYSNFKLKGITYRLTRVAYCVANKCDMPVDKVVMHSCNNPKCINPKHLSLGTNQDNIDYRVKCNRSAKGEFHGCAVHTEDEIWDLLLRIYKGEFKSHQQIVNYGYIKSTTLYNLLNGNIWKYLTDKFCEQYSITLCDLKKKCCNPTKKLTSDQVHQIRADIHLNVYELSKKYGIGYETARQIRLGNSHKDVI